MRTILELLHFTKKCMHSVFGDDMNNFNTAMYPGFCMLFSYMKLGNFANLKSKHLSKDEVNLLSNYIFEHLPDTAYQWCQPEDEETIGLEHMLLFPKYYWKERYDYINKLIEDEEKKTNCTE